jgi:hypothetical protein
MSGPALFGLEPEPDAPQEEAALVVAARATIQALRGQNAIQAWHELDCEIVLETARGVTTSKGIAKSQMVSALLQARAKLPEPVVAESDDVLAYEADRDMEWLERHANGTYPDPAHVQDRADAPPIH